MIDPDQRELDSYLAHYINPERSRSFDPARWQSSRLFLAELAQQSWLKPECPVIHIVGSNGKGSTAWYLAALIQKHLQNSAKQVVALYSSPHLQYVTERIRFNLKEVSATEALQALQFLAEHPDLKSKWSDLSYFEILTILFLYLSRQKRAAFQILEAGLGGRLDATRMAAGQTVVLAELSLEHTALLGNTLEKIAAEKLGALGPQCQSLFAWQDYQSLVEKQLDLLAIQSQDINPNLQKVFIERNTEHNYLQQNQSLAQAVGLHLLGHSPDTIPTLLPPPGRLEIHKTRDYTLVFDVAHNPSAVQKSLSDIKSLLAPRPKSDILVFVGLLKDRDLQALLKQIQKNGFNQICLLQGTDLAPISANLSPELPRIKIDHMNAYLQKHPTIKTIIILGSHRHYNAFTSLLEQLHDTSSSN